MNVLRTSKHPQLHWCTISPSSLSSCHITEMSLSVNSTRANVVCFCNSLNKVLLNVTLLYSSVLHTFLLSESRHYRQTTAVPMSIVSHDGTDVPIYAVGPMSHLFHTTHEQHYIFHVMKYASCLGNEARTHAHCQARYSSKRLAELHSFNTSPSLQFGTVPYYLMCVTFLLLSLS